MLLMRELVLSMELVATQVVAQELITLLEHSFWSLMKMANIISYQSDAFSSKIKVFYTQNIHSNTIIYNNKAG